MVNKTLLLSLLFAAACSSGPQRSREHILQPGSVGVRLTAGATKSKMKATKTTVFFGQTFVVNQTFDATEPFGRVELNQALNENTTLGAYVDLGHADYDADSVEDHISFGAIFRQYAGKDALRPFLEARGGYRENWVGDISGGGYDIGGALGVEYDVSKRTSLHVQAGYELGSGDLGNVTTDFSGPTFSIGGSVRF